MEKELSYQQKKYRKLKSQGICVTCGHVKAEPGRVRCRECLIKRGESNRRYYRINQEEMQAKQRIRNRQRREKLKALGICLVCGKRPMINSYECEVCQRQRRDMYKIP